MRFRVSLFILGLILMSVMGVAAPAQASSLGDILPPFTVGEQWWICQGYNNPAVTHTGTSAYGLDLTGSPSCGNGASGRTVIAPVGGTIAYYQAAYGNLCVNVGGNRSYTLTHIDSNMSNGIVSAGQVVGAVASAGARNNNGVAHIHFQMWTTPNCYSSSGIPFDSAHGARICGAPDLIAGGPNGGNGTWSGTSFIGASCDDSGSGLSPQIIALKRTTDPDGTRQVYAATKTAVTEAWWHPGGDGVHSHTMITIAQNNIVGFDKVNLPGGTQALYTAVPDGVWETWWKSDGSTGTNKIISGLSGVRGVIAYNDTEGGNFVHHLYVLASDGPHEAWWVDGGDGVHVGLLMNINGPVAFTQSVDANGTMQLYVAVPTWVYEVWWTPGSGSVHAGPIINISQADIRSVTKYNDPTTGLQELYTTTSTTVWQSKWGGGLSNIQTTAFVTGQVNPLQTKKTVTGGDSQLYLATSDHVQEYWSNTTGSGGGTLINIAQNNIGAMDKVNDGTVQDLYTGAGSWVYETWWGGGVGPTTGALFSVTS